MNKKGYIFIIDGILAMIILGAGFFLISSSLESQPATITARQLPRDILSVLSVIKVDDICIDHCTCQDYPNLGDKYCHKTITMGENSLLEALAEVYTRTDDPEIIKSLAKEMLIDTHLLPAGYALGMFLWEKDTSEPVLLYTTDPPDAKSQDTSLFLTSAKKLVFGMYYPEQDRLAILPYYIIELRVWQE